MSYIRKKTIHPSAMGGMDQSETMYSGAKYYKSKNQYGGKKKTRKAGGKIKLAGMGIKAKPAIQPSFRRGKGPGITRDW